ncbi:VOC family protein [Pseudomonas sp. DTU_2021_1001937_2_SI_NGA_ILE_001]|uniref:VOC family protein n=1 Tax=Pseudomonas sp. DTU_2021_1001937_2_SI_NGA_ILE_001 TaxID=3077589 RepID=UPI0028FC26E0|nr:VOC family protein [Pseudomonas sp. DTU_2021_1001937_2_SI_NGA_ILE_001]WNW13771.1 VOC family protein [Pseudomonas sp. DTU_2021_1001937_2_SI_NGA_ILE_001]
MSVRPIPEDFHTVTVYLGVHDGNAAIDFYERVFGARLEFRLDRPDGRVGHAELYIGDTRIMLSEPCEEGALSSPPLALHPDSPCKSSVGLHLYVQDVDATFELAMDEEGVSQVNAVKDHFYGDRSGALRDPFGHLWFISTHKQDVSPEEIKERARKLFGGHE